MSSCPEATPREDRSAGTEWPDDGARLWLWRDQRSPDPGVLTVLSMDHKACSLRELRAA